MRNNLISIIIVLLSSCSQDSNKLCDDTVYDGDIYFEYQQEIDDFEICFTKINGNVTLRGRSITNVRALKNLTSIKNLTVIETNIESFNGLNKLVELDNFLF